MADKQWGGWYWQPELGRAQRWWNGVWTDGEEPGGQQQQSSGSSGGMDKAVYDQNYNNLKSEVEKYIAELVKQANGDYDFAAKWIEANYTQAAGNNDQQRMAILKEVANDVEKSVGRLGYDYQTGKYRIEQNQTTALSRLKEDEQVLTRQYTEKAAQMRREQETNLNQRGILSAPRDEVGGLAGAEVQRLDTGIQDQFSELRRGFTRNTEDINLNASRGMEDLNTGTRRGYEDATESKTYSLEEAQRRKAAQLAALEREKAQQLMNASSLAETMTLRSQLGA